MSGPEDENEDIFLNAEIGGSDEIKPSEEPIDVKIDEPGVMPKVTPKKPLVSNKHYDSTEVDYIKKNWKYKTDKEIAKVLGRSEQSVADKRGELGLKKVGGRPGLAATVESLINEGTEEALSHLSKKDRVALLKQHFNKNPRYLRLKEELSDVDLEFYKHKYIEFMETVDTLHVQEEDMLHHMIMADLHISRIRRQLRRAEEKEEETEGAQPIPAHLYMELKVAEERLVNYHKTLRITREQRLSKEREEKVTLTGLIKAFEEKKAREEFGHQASVMEFNTDQARKQMNKMQFLLGDDYSG